MKTRYACIFQLSLQFSMPTQNRRQNYRFRQKCKIFIFGPPRTRKIGEFFAPLWKVPGHLFKRIINRITAICDHPRHESASFNAEQDDAMAPKASHAITCMHTWEIVHWLKKLNYSFAISMSKNHSIFCLDKSFWIFSTLSTSSQCSLMNLNRYFSLLIFRSPSDISHRTSFWW